jgi:hypothetical protein
MPLRRSDVIEVIGERAVSGFVIGVVMIAFGSLLYYYRGDGYLVGLAWVLILGGIGLLGLTVYSGMQMRKVSSFSMQCPFCSGNNELTAPPDDDFKCSICERVIPIRGGEVLEVFQVRCGFCNELNWYSEKNDVLICEKCNHEIPLTIEEGRPVRHVPKAYAVTEDERLYELVLVGQGN